MRFFISFSVFLSICFSSYSSDQERGDLNTEKNLIQKKTVHFHESSFKTPHQRFKTLRVMLTVAAYVATVYGFWKMRKHPLLKPFSNFLSSASPLFFLTLNASALVVWSRLLLSSDLGMHLTETVMGQLSQQD